MNNKSLTMLLIILLVPLTFIILAFFFIKSTVSSRKYNTIIAGIVGFYIALLINSFINMYY